MAEWAEHGFTEVETQTWRQQFSLEEAATWRDAGFAASDAAAWESTEGMFDVEEATRWHDAGFTPREADRVGRTVHDSHGCQACKRIVVVGSWRRVTCTCPGSLLPDYEGTTVREVERKQPPWLDAWLVLWVGRSPTV